MKRIFIKLLSIMLLGCFVLSGCGIREGALEDSTSSDEGMAITDESLLESGQVYILRDGVYYPTYVSAASFDTSDNTSTDTSRTLWYSEDEWKNVPTLYEGDTLIYHTDENYDETFYIERFEYIGWTFGISNLTQSDTGRYYISYDDTDYVDSASSIYQIMTLGEFDNIFIDTVGGVELRAGNVTDGGVIIGLEKDLNYKLEVYTGTNLTEITVTADRIALTSMDCDEINDYVFDHSTTVTISLPDYYNSGYYAINGVGLFRYVKDADSWDEETDFNVANAEEAEEETITENEDEESAEASADASDLDEEEGLSSP